MAQEITDAFVHLMDVGGTGGVPIDEERCLQYAKKTFVALKDYFCLMCNPRHIQYFGCCYDKYKIGGNCVDPLGLATTDQLMQKYGEGTCINKASDTIRICKTFADKLWGKDGSKYDQCGMMTWVMHREDIVADENAWSDDDDGDGKQDGNPGEIVPWGDVDGRTGELFFFVFFWFFFGFFLVFLLFQYRVTFGLKNNYWFVLSQQCFLILFLFLSLFLFLHIR